MSERLRVWLRALRVEQWTKNGVVLMAWFFSVADTTHHIMHREYLVIRQAILVLVDSRYFAYFCNFGCRREQLFNVA